MEFHSVADRALRRLCRSLPPSVAAAVDRCATIRSCKDLLSFGEHELVEALDLYLPEVRTLVLAASRALAKPRTALQLDPSLAAGGAGPSLSSLHSAAIPGGGPAATGLAGLDAHLGGGLPCRALTELVGPAGVGKTQCCLQVASRVLVDGDAAKTRVLYVDTEGSFSASRLHQLLARHLRARLGSCGSASAPTTGESASAAADRMAEQLLDRVTVLRPASWSQYTACLHEQLENELTAPPRVGLLIVDSVASAVRVQYNRGSTGGGGSGATGGGSSEVAKRQQHAGAAAARLKFYADRFGICVLCVNQVASGAKSDTPYGAADPGDVGAVQGRDDAALLAYLGTAWAHCVNVRLVLQYPRFTSQLPHLPPPGVVGQTPPRPMLLKVAKAPMAKCEAEFEYCVDREAGLTEKIL